MQVGLHNTHRSCADCVIASSPLPHSFISELIRASGDNCIFQPVNLTDGDNVGAFWMLHSSRKARGKRKVAGGGCGWSEGAS
jgi:hypothetical protein